SYDTLTGNLLRRAGVRRRALLVGTGEHLSHLHEMLGRSRRGIDYEFVGVLAPDLDGIELPLLGDLKALPRVLATHRVDEVILADSDFGEGELLETVEQAHRRGVKVRIAPKTTELLVQRADYVPGQSVPLFEVRSPVFAGGEWVLKRTFDLTVSVIVLLAGLPLWLLTAAAVTLTSPGPVLYRDRRIGLGEREFDMLKFRTMYADAAEHQPYLEQANEATGPLFKMRRDPRVTPVGALLRRCSFDEVPQLFNVLHGEMSLVGPRPLPLRDYDQLEDWHRKRYNVLPGITGLWQISGRSNLSFAGGCNRGAAEANGDVLVFLNPDTVVDPGALTRLAETLQDPSIGIAMARLRLLARPELLNSAGTVLHLSGLAWAGRYGEPA